MPFTPCHAALVLPLRIWGPRTLSGTALVVGSLAPDLEYFWWGTTRRTVGHSAWGQLTCCLPVGLGLTLLCGWLLPIVAPHLPAWLAPRTLARAGVGRRGWLAWALLPVCVLIGSGSHVAWDGFTHADMWPATRIAWLQSTAFTLGGVPKPWCGVLQQLSTLLGGLGVLTCLAALERRSLPLEEPPPSRAQRLRLWLPVALLALLGVAVSLSGNLAAGVGAKHVLVDAFLRGSSLAFLGLIVGAALVRRAARQVG